MARDPFTGDIVQLKIAQGLWPVGIVDTISASTAVNHTRDTEA